MASEQPEETPTKVTDKRGSKKPGKEMPTAQELLDQDQGETEFERQKREAEEDARRAAEFAAMSPEDREALLAQQAAEAGSVPFAGGGIQTDSEVKHEVLSVFVIVIDLDGTANAMPVEAFDPAAFEVQRDVTPRMMYRACSEIMMDVQVAETSHTTLQMFKTVGDMVSAQQRQQALAQQLHQRGMKPRG